MTPGDFRAALTHLRRLIVDAQYKRALNLIDTTLKTDDEAMQKIESFDAEEASCELDRIQRQQEAVPPKDASGR